MLRWNVQRHVELINPPFTKCNDSDQLLVVEMAPALTGREHALSAASRKKDSYYGRPVSWAERKCQQTQVI